MVRLLIILALGAVVFGAVQVWERAVAFNDAVSTRDALSIGLFGPFAGDERVNVLLLGYSDESREGAFLSDSMNVLSIDPAADETALIAIPRDLWVEGVAEVPENMKMNEAFRIGYYADGLEDGAELAATAVGHVTGLEIDGWITLDFQGFSAMVDAAGGITVDNPRGFRYTLHRPNYEAGDFRHEFAAGTLDLDGREALDYARSRYTDVPEESSDFARSVRQQRVLAALRGKVGPGEVMKMADALEGHLHTNLSVLDLAMLAGHLDVDRRVAMPEGKVLTATTNTLGQYILVVIGQATTTDYSPLHAHIRDRLAAPLPKRSPSASPSS
jgi:LCP family protein required for cell wall assembly